MHVELSSHVSLLADWWHGLLAQPTLNALQFHDACAGIVNVSGILGLIQVEEKIVKGQPKNLLILHLTDASGRIEVRSWNHEDADFKRFQEQPVLLKRVRVVLFAGQKVGEMLGGTNGTTATSEFDSVAQRQCRCAHVTPVVSHSQLNTCHCWLVSRCHQSQMTVELYCRSTA